MRMVDRFAGEFRWNRLLAVIAAAGFLCSRAHAGGPVKELPTLDVENVAVVNKPVLLTFAPGDPARRFVVELLGRIRVIRDGELLPTPFVDLTSLVAPQIGERGLKCIAFHPDYQANGYFFVIYVSPTLHTTIARFQRDPANPDRSLLASQKVLLSVLQTNPNHNGDWVGFGPDGYLYASLGEGGTWQQAIDLNNLQGKVLRLDVDVPDAGPPYAIPPDNPFIGVDGLDEIWAYGFRNPWRLSFDRLTGDLWISDVGAGWREEATMQPAASKGGEFYGWGCMEGTFCHPLPGTCPCPPPNAIPPTFDYGHDELGTAIIGGFVYRGSTIPNLNGLYLFSDAFSGRVFSFDPATQEIRIVISGLPGAQYSLGEDIDGELYVMGPNIVRKIVHDPDCDDNGIADALEISAGTAADCNRNGLPDSCDIALGNSLDLNGTGIPDECENDCNLNGIDDLIDIARGTSPDCDGDSVPDECQLADGELDCNSNDILDVCEIAANPNLDLNGSGVIDTCETSGDLNGDGLVNGIDLGILLAGWSIPPTAPACGGITPCPPDLNMDGVVNGFDLGILLANWTL